MAFLRSAAVRVWRQTMRRSHSTAASGALNISKEVRDAIAEGRPVVALESTIISHGMVSSFWRVHCTPLCLCNAVTCIRSCISGTASTPISISLISFQPFPKNLETALEVENIVRANGAVPATIALAHGKVHVGLDLDTLEQLASAPVGTCVVAQRLKFISMFARFQGETLPWLWPTSAWVPPQSAQRCWWPIVLAFQSSSLAVSCCNYCWHSAVSPDQDLCLSCLA